MLYAPLVAPLFYCCQSTELTRAFGSIGDGWNFEEEAPANLAQNAAFPPTGSPPADAALAESRDQRAPGNLPWSAPLLLHIHFYSF